MSAYSEILWYCNYGMCMHCMMCVACAFVKSQKGLPVSPSVCCGIKVDSFSDPDELLTDVTNLHPYIYYLLGGA